MPQQEDPGADPHGQRDEAEQRQPGSRDSQDRGPDDGTEPEHEDRCCDLALSDSGVPLDGGGDQLAAEGDETVDVGAGKGPDSKEGGIEGGRSDDGTVAPPATVQAMAAAARSRAPDDDQLLRAAEIIAAVLPPSPLVEASVSGRRLWLKLESLQPTGSFKVRGALAALAAAAAEDPATEIVACSAGNHGLGVAFAAARLGTRATVVVPMTASPAKLARLREFDVELQLVGAGYEQAETHAQVLAEQRGARFVSPYDDDWVIAGQATMAAEVLVQRPSAARLIVGVGGGGLAAGSILATRGSEVIVHGVQLEQNAAFAAALAGRQIDPAALGSTIADGIAGGIDASSITLQILRSARFELSLVSEAATRTALAACAHDAGLVIEGSAAAALAAALERPGSEEGETVVAISGRNIATELLGELLGTQTL